MSIERTPPPLKIVETTSSSSQSQSQSTEGAAMEPDPDVQLLLAEILDGVSVAGDIAPAAIATKDEEAVEQSEDTRVQIPKNKNRKKRGKAKTTELPFADREFPRSESRKRCERSPTELSQAAVDEILQSHVKAPASMAEVDVIDKVATVSC